MPQFFYTWVRDSGTRSDGHEYCKETDPDKGLDEEVLIQEEEGDDKEADIDDVVGMSTLIPVMIVMMLQIPMSPPVVTRCG